MRVLIVLTAGDSVGYGHVYRAITFLNFINREFTISDVRIAFIDTNSHGVTCSLQILKEHGFLYCSIFSIEDISKYFFDMLITDCLGKIDFYIENFSNFFRLWISVDSTVPVYSHEPNLRINPLYPSAGAYNGVRYSLLDNHLDHIRRKNIDCNNVPKNTLLLSQGGADAHNLIVSLYDVLKNLVPPSTNIKILPGSRTNISLIERNMRSNDILLTKYSSKELIFNDVTAAITSGGLMMVEAAYIGLPLLIVSNEEKEIKTISELKDLNLLIDYFHREENIQEKLLAFDFRYFFSEGVYKSQKSVSSSVFSIDIWKRLKEIIEDRVCC